MSNLTMSYTVQYWNERDLEWRGCGVTPTTDIEFARTRMRGLSDQTQHTVRFRVTQVAS